VPICDGHDSAIITINFELIRHGIEVIYLGYHRSAREIARAAIQEDVRAVGLSSYNGGHVEFFSEVLQNLKRHGAKDIGVFGGGGGTITPEDARIMKRRGVDEIFFAGTPLATMIEFVRHRYRIGPRAVLGSQQQRMGKEAGFHSQIVGRSVMLRAGDGSQPGGATDRDIAMSLTVIEQRAAAGRADGPVTAGLHRSGFGKMFGTHGSSSFRMTGNRGNSFPPPIVGITGPGGAGKTTLIDELVLRFLRATPRGRLAILSHDPSLVEAGALLGDRAAMIYSQDDRVFMRSFATRGQTGGLSRATGRALDLLQRCNFDLIIVETAGIGQEAIPFGPRLAKSVLVMSPDYGSRLQLQKIAMLDAADIVVVNKADLPGARTASAEIEQRLRRNGRGQLLVSTVAKRHRDAGVDRLFAEMMR
jgi:methylmalonyl-CoA mutase